MLTRSICSGVEESTGNTPGVLGPRSNPVELVLGTSGPILVLCILAMGSWRLGVGCVCLLCVYPRGPGGLAGANVAVTLPCRREPRATG